MSVISPSPDVCLVLNEETMFRGKNLPVFLERYAPVFAQLVEEHGIEKVTKVYDYFFGYLSNMHWGQYFVLSKLCPDYRYVRLVFWCLECIYQSDLFSQFEIKHVPLDDGDERDEVRVYVVEPTAEQKHRWKPFLRTDARYSLIDWYGRLRNDHSCLPEVNPEWLMLEHGDSCGDESIEAGPEDVTD